MLAPAVRLPWPSQSPHPSSCVCQVPRQIPALAGVCMVLHTSLRCASWRRLLHLFNVTWRQGVRKSGFSAILSTTAVHSPEVVGPVVLSCRLAVSGLHGASNVSHTFPPPSRETGSGRQSSTWHASWQRREVCTVRWSVIVVGAAPPPGCVMWDRGTGRRPRRARRGDGECDGHGAWKTCSPLPGTAAPSYPPAWPASGRAAASSCGAWHAGTPGCVKPRKSRHLHARLDSVSPSLTPCSKHWHLDVPTPHPLPTPRHSVHASPVHSCPLAAE